MKALEKHLQKRKVLCFLDLEGTQFSHEMIALGAVKVHIRKDGSVRKIHKGYYTLVKAKNHIGKVVTDLTGITEEDLKKNGISLRLAIKGLKEYLGHDFTKSLFVTFGSHDIRIISQSLAHNMDVKKEDIQNIIKHSFDISEFISQYVKDPNGNTYSLANMLKVFNVEFKGTQHNALADALNLVYLYEAFLKNKDIVKVEYRNVLKQMKHLPDPVHDLIIKILEDNNVTAEDFDKMIENSLE